ncbi:hypothetical protein D3C77_492180 [compost metagenome]
MANDRTPNLSAASDALTHLSSFTQPSANILRPNETLYEDNLCKKIHHDLNESLPFFEMNIMPGLYRDHFIPYRFLVDSVIVLLFHPCYITHVKYW